MKRKVIEAFDYAADGVHANRLKVGRSYEFPEQLARRFEDEGKLAPLKTAGGAAEAPAPPTRRSKSRRP